MPPSARGSSGARAMTDPIVALIIAVALGAYLVFTLLRPERF
jgi:K+-transporting ATPase KdpF subunit